MRVGGSIRATGNRAKVAAAPRTEAEITIKLDFLAERVKGRVRWLAPFSRGGFNQPSPRFRVPSGVTRRSRNREEKQVENGDALFDSLSPPSRSIREIAASSQR